MIKKYFLIALIIVACFILIFLGFIVYKKINKGNNISKFTSEELANYILKIESYEAELRIKVESNKNRNDYIVKQIFDKEKGMKQIVLEPTTIAGIETTYKDGILKINNTKMNLTKMYENYPDISDNILWLNSFIIDYNKYESSDLKEEEKEIIMRVKLSNSSNKYNTYKELYVNKETGKPSKLIIKDINQNKIVHIEYNEIEINNIKEDILAFKL